MALYDYECVQCSTRFEASHAISAPSPDCPACGGKAKKVFLSAPAAHGHMALGREQAVRSLQTDSHSGGHTHGAGCQCCRSK